MKTSCYIVFLLFIFSAVGFAQSNDYLSFSISPLASVPLGEDTEYFKTGAGVSAKAEFSLFPYIKPYLTAGYLHQPSYSNDPLVSTFAGAGLDLAFSPINRAVIRPGADIGLYSATWNESQAANYYYQVGSSLGFRLTPGITIQGGAHYLSYLGPESPLFSGLTINLSAHFSVAGLLGGSNMEIQETEIDPIFPIFYAQYEENSIGKVRIVNREQGDITNVRVSFFVKQFMDQPKLSSTLAHLGRGRSMDVDLYALFTDEVLKLTEGTRVNSEIIVEYDFFNSKRVAKSNQTLRVNHRNAMTWDDDRKAAAFVSSKDPAVMRFSKFAVGIIRESGSVEINENLRFAMGLFEALRLYGLNYVVDPTTPYTELSLSENVVDYLQYPHQTLTYRGGDCDDLSILFSAILESVGIPTAFITIPGHIYMALSVNMTESEARKTFLNPEELIYINDQAWFPVEVTLLNEGFMKAWQVGAKQWYDNTDSARLYPIHEAWTVFEPVGIPGVDSRVVLPNGENIQTVYSDVMAKFINREISPRVERMKLGIRQNPRNPSKYNSLGVLYARYGLLKEAENEFERALGIREYLPALINLGNIQLLQQNYDEAIAYYNKAHSASPENPKALLGIARANYELENYEKVNQAFAELEQKSPDVAMRYSYLISRNSGVARASSAAAQRGRAEWDDEEE